MYVSASPSGSLAATPNVTMTLVNAGFGVALGADATTGASGTGVTVSRKVSLPVSSPSETRTVIVVVPNWLGAGVIVSVRLPPLPPKTKPAGSTIEALLDVA